MKKLVSIIVVIAAIFSICLDVIGADTDKGISEKFIYPTALSGLTNEGDINLDNQIATFGIDSEEVSEEIDNILSIVNENMTDVEKALVVHDYMALNYRYDYDNYLNDTIPRESYTMTGLLTNKTGVCQAYSDTYKYIMNLLDISCVTVSSDSMNHAWNMINLDGNWYHVDVTWDDPVVDLIGRVRHEYFLLSDNEIKERKHYGWRTSIVADDNTYDDFFWRDVDSAIVLLDGNVFYASDSGIEKRQGFDGIPDVLYSFRNTYWYVWDKNGYYWQKKYSG